MLDPHFWYNKWQAPKWVGDTLRVICGSLKGFTIKTPKNRATRPATELVRGALFSMLDNLNPGTDSILDLFAGSGSLSLEALSRGYKKAVLVERNSAVCQVARENLLRAGMADNSQVWCLKVEAALKKLTQPFDLIVMDLPYRQAESDDFIAYLLSQPVVGQNTILAVNHSIRQELRESYHSFGRVKHSRHGDSVISIFQYAEV